MKKVIKKLYKGLVDIRDYDVQTCIDKNESLTVDHGNERMILTPEELLSKKVKTSAVFKSTVGGKDYRLFSYEWDPIDEL